MDVEVTAGQDDAPAGTDLVMRVSYEGIYLLYSVDFRYVILKTSLNGPHDKTIIE